MPETHALWLREIVSEGDVCDADSSMAERFETIATVLDAHAHARARARARETTRVNLCQTDPQTPEAKAAITELVAAAGKLLAQGARLDALAMEVCGAMCPSVKKTGTEWPHVPACRAFTAALQRFPTKTPEPPPCIRCGGPTELYGRFHTTEWNCQDADGCGSYVLMSDRIGDDGTKVEPTDA